MENREVDIVCATTDFIEKHLREKLDLDTVATAVHYSKYHLHRIFTEIVGLTIHDYVQRRQLTEAAKLLVFSKKSILEIALTAGYESQQAFATIFKVMYKQTPAQYRQNESFYPLQLEYVLKKHITTAEILKSNIQFAQLQDIPFWMDLVRLVVDGFPCLMEQEYVEQLKESIAQQKALILYDGEIAVGVMAFSYESGSIEFLGVHPQYRRRNVTKAFLDKLLDELLIGKEISITTFRENDKADTGYRAEYKQLGFAEKELLTEFGYPTQRFVLPPKQREETINDTK